MEEKNPRKILFIAVGVVLVLLLVWGLSAFGSDPAKTAKDKPVAAQVTLWTVGLDTQAFDALAAGFKAANPKYAAATFTAKKFASYEQYEKFLPRAIADGNSPDIITVTNDGGWNALGGYVERLPAQFVNPADFRRDYPAFLVDDLLLEDAQDVAVPGDAPADPKAKGKAPAETVTQVASFLKGVPLGYETLAVFYNSRKMRGVPATWSGFPEMVQDGVLSAAGGSPFGSGNSGPDAFVPVGLGLGTSVPGSADVFALMLAQQGVRGPKALPTATRVLESYQAFANSPENGLARLAPEMRSQGLTVLDMFMRGQVGAVVGFPSLAREIEYASKRAATGEAKVILRSVRAAPVPQAFAVVPPQGEGSGAPAKGTLAVNLVRYRYLALSKFSKNPDAAAQFLAYLATKPGQSAAAKSFPWLIPAHREVAVENLKAPIAPDWKVTKESFVTEGAELVGFDKSNPVAWDARLPAVLDLYDADAPKALASFSAYLSCVADQDAGKGFDVACQ